MHTINSKSRGQVRAAYRNHLWIVNCQLLLLIIFSGTELTKHTVKSPNKEEGPFPDFAIFGEGALPILEKSAMTVVNIISKSSKNRGGAFW